MFEYSAELSYRRSGHPTAGSAVPHSGETTRSGEIRRTLRRLIGQRLRFSLCQLVFPQGRGTAQDIIRAIDDPALIADVAPDGRLIVLFVGPRRRGSRGDQNATATIIRKLGRALLSQGLGQKMRREQKCDLASARVSTLHAWADTYGESSALFAALAAMPTVPLSELLSAIA